MLKLNGEMVIFTIFPNKESKIAEDSINPTKTLGGPNVIEFKYTEDGDLIKLMILNDYLKEQLLMSDIELIIYYMPYSRMDRSENNSVFTLKYISKFINSMNFKSVKIVEPHSDVTPALVDRATAISFTPQLIKMAAKEVNFNKDEDILFYPDAGAQKRYDKFKGYKSLVGYKSRDFQTGEIKELQVVGDKKLLKNKKVIIVDDLCSYGGTFVKSAKLLKQYGAKEIYLIITHSENSILKGELFKHVDKVFTTDSLITEQPCEENLKIYKIDKLLKKFN